MKEKSIPSYRNGSSLKMLGSFERQGFEPCDSKPKTHPVILSGKTLPLEELSSQGDLFDTFSGRICIGDFSR